MQTSGFQQLLERVAARLGAKIIFVDPFAYAGRIEFANGIRSFFKGTTFDVNPQGAANIASDKDYAAKFLSQLGYSVPDGILVFSARSRTAFERLNRDVYTHLGGNETAIEFSQRVGFPVFIKPNDESEGRGVIKAYTIQQLTDDLQALFSWCDQVLIQRPVEGNDFRVVVLDGKVISAYQRWPFRVKGDGRSSLAKLRDDKIQQLRIAGRGKKIDLSDPRYRRELGYQNRSLDDIIPDGELVYLLPNANLSTGGEAEDCTSLIHPTYAKLCVDIARDMALPLCGIDLITDDIRQAAKSPTVLEINSAPGLNNFAATGEHQAMLVEQLYDRIFCKLRDGH